MALHALVIGIDYENNDLINKLDYAVDDSSQMHKFLLGAGYESLHFTDLKAGSVRVVGALEAICKNLKSGDTFVFYFSGHGFENEFGQYLLPNDAHLWSIENGGGNAIALDFIEKATAIHGVKRILIIDACRKSLSRNKSVFGGSGGVTEKAIIAAVKNASKESSIAILCGCKKGSIASEFKGLKGSVFTQALLDIFENRRRAGEEIALPDIFKSVQERALELQENHSPLPGRQRPYFRGDFVVLLSASNEVDDSFSAKAGTWGKDSKPSMRADLLAMEAEQKKKREEILSKIMEQKRKADAEKNIPPEGGFTSLLEQPFARLPDESAEMVKKIIESTLPISCGQKETGKKADKMLQLILSDHKVWLQSDRKKESNRLTWKKLEPVLKAYREANLGHPDLSDANMKMADFSNCEMIKGVRFAGANLIAATFELSVLSEVDFSNCNMEITKCAGSTMNSCCFSRALLSFTDFRMASLTDCDFGTADIFYAKFDDAIIEPPDPESPLGLLEIAKQYRLFS